MEICRDLTDCRARSAFFGLCNIFSHRCKPFLSIPICLGEVAEWSKAVDSKSIVRLSVPGVRIPPSPPSIVTLRSSALKWIYTIYNGSRLIQCSCSSITSPLAPLMDFPALKLKPEERWGTLHDFERLMSLEISPVSESKIVGSTQFRGIHESSGISFSKSGRSG